MTLPELLKFSQSDYDLMLNNVENDQTSRLLEALAFYLDEKSKPPQLLTYDKNHKEYHLLKTSYFVLAVYFNKSLDLVSSALDAVKKNHLQALAVLSRSHLEHTVYTASIYAILIQDENIDKRIELIKNRFMSSKHESMKDILPKMTNIITLIQKADKLLNKLSGTSNDTALMDAYDDLSSYCHPNYESHNMHFQIQINKDGNFSTIEPQTKFIGLFISSLILSINCHNLFHTLVDDLTLEIATANKMLR